MPFFRDLRRRSKSSKRSLVSEWKAPDDNGSESSNGTEPTTRSTLTLNSVSGTATPMSSLQPSLSSASISRLNRTGSPSGIPQRPSPASASSQNKRYTMSALPGPGSEPPSKLPPSLYAPKVVSVSDNSWVHQKILLLYGQCGDPFQRTLDGTLTITHHQDCFPQTSWPVCDSRFKALVHLNPGPNELRLDFFSSKLALNGGSTSLHSTKVRINFLPLVNSPPLQLVIMLGSDSPGTFDATPERIQREGNDVETAIRKYRMAAYLWQAFTGEQMYRKGLGRRCFRFEEAWQTGSSSIRDRETGQMRNEAKVHVVRSERTVAELRSLRTKDALFNVAMDAVRDCFRPSKDQTQYVSVLLLDSQWDPESKSASGHAAFAGGSDDVRLAVFGSQTLQNYPSSIEEVVPSFTDCTRTDAGRTANVDGDSGSSWEAANAGIGAHLQQIGHMFGSPRQERGVMEKDYRKFGRTFLTREAYSTRTEQQGMRLVTSDDECEWHRLDTLRFRCHPCFRLVSDPPWRPEDRVQVWPVDQGRVVATAKAGIAFVEIFTDADEVCTTWLEYPQAENADMPKQVVLAEEELRARLPAEKKGRKLRLEIHSAGQAKFVVHDMAALTSKRSQIKMAKGHVAYRGSAVGEGGGEGAADDLLLLSAMDKTKLMTSVRIFHGSVLYGMEFAYEGFRDQMFGGRGEQADAACSEFLFDTRRGEVLLGLYVRADTVVKGIEVLTNLGRRSGVYGNPTGGTGHTLMPPRGYSIAGLSGSSDVCIDSLALIITR